MQVSVIIPVYNAENFVSQAVESCLMQPETGEIILVEDASPDKSLEVYEKLESKYRKVRLFRKNDRQNVGAGASPVRLVRCSGPCRWRMQSVPDCIRKCVAPVQLKGLHNY